MDQRRILITGSNGQLGRALRIKFPEATFTDSTTLDITDKDQLKNYNWDDFSIVINAAAYTKVDEAETPDGRRKAWKVNAEAVANLVRIANEKDLILVHISSDYVFDGSTSNHTEDEPLSPLGVYGQSKAAGDIAASLANKSYIIRTSWVIGDGNNFVRTMLSLASKGVNPRVVNDQIGRPSFTNEILRAIEHLLITRANYGTYNVSNDGLLISWATFARAVFLNIDADLNVHDITTVEYMRNKPGIAQRPKQSQLNLSKLKSTGFKPNDWKSDLKIYIRQLM